MPRVLRDQPVLEREVATTFLRWTYMRAVFRQGYWLVASLYLVIDAHLKGIFQCPGRVRNHPANRAS